MHLTIKKILLIVLFNFLLGILTLLFLSPLPTPSSLNSPKLFLQPSINTSSSSTSPSSYPISTSFGVCKTNKNYYSPDEIKQIFKYQNYGPCTSIANDTISFHQDKLIVKCQSNNTPEYATDFNFYESYGGARKHRPVWSPTLPDLSQKQFLLIKCSDVSFHALVFNRFSKQISQQANDKKPKQEVNKKQMSVLLLVFDSVSRYSFQRNLPKTMEFLDGLEYNKDYKDYFSVFEFDKAAATEVRTRWNMAQILYGKSLDEVAEVVGTGTHLFWKNSKIYKEYQKNAIWSHYSSLGFVTMFSHNTVQDDLSQVTGRFIKTDHVFTNFWRFLWGVFNWYDTQNGQQCVGNRNSHDFSLDYTYQFFDNYKDNHKFAYVHVNAAHEETGNVKTIDDDLVRFLRKYLSMIQNKEENLALFLISDHGYKQIQGAQWDFRSFYEYVTPMTYLIVTKEVVKVFKAEENLKHNTKQLISRYDLNLSLKHLAYFPYNIALKNWYLEGKDYYTYKDTVSLFEEKVNIDRTCNSIGVQKEFCLCSGFEPVEIDEIEEVIRQEMIFLFTQALRTTGSLKSKCEVDKSLTIAKAERFILKNVKFGLDSLYKMEFRTKKNSEVFVDYNFCLADRINSTKEILDERLHPYSFFDIEIGAVFLQISGFNMSSECKKDFCDC